MDALTCLLTRTSTGALMEPAPNSAELELIFKAACRAPDHAALKPWRFLVVQGDARYALGDALVAAALAKDAHLTDAQQQRFRSMPLRAPVIIIAYASTTDSTKVPVSEQCYAVAAACQNILLAAHAQGYAGIWRTGDLMESPHLKSSLSLANADKIIACLYLGTAKSNLTAPSTDILPSIVRYWP